MAVVEIPKKAPRIWICDCGCSTFELLESGWAQCASCADDLEHGTWFEKIKGGKARPEDAEEPFSDIQGNGSVDFAMHSARRAASQADLKVLVAVNAEGKVTAWTGAETKNQIEWVLDRIDQGRALIAAWPDKEG